MVWITECHISRYMMDRVMILVSKYSLKPVLSDKTNNSILMKNSTSSFLLLEWVTYSLYSTLVFARQTPQCHQYHRECK